MTLNTFLYPLRRLGAFQAGNQLKAKFQADARALCGDVLAVLDNALILADEGALWLKAGEGNRRIKQTE